VGTRSCRTNGQEKTGYPTQKPEGIIRRMVQASSSPGDWCLDFFAGSGTLGAVAASLGRRYVLIDSNPEAVEIMRARLRDLRPLSLMYHLELRQSSTTSTTSTSTTRSCAR